MAEAVEFVPITKAEELVIDIDAVLAMISPEVRVKRTFVDFALRSVEKHTAREQLLASVQVDLDRYPQFFDDMPWHDYFRVAHAAAEILRPGRPGWGLRDVGRSFYPYLLRTPIGNLLLGRYLGEALRKLGPVWDELNTIGNVTSSPRGEREFDYHFVDYPYSLIETTVAGIFEGVFSHHHMPAEFRVARLGQNDAILRMSW